MLVIWITCVISWGGHKQISMQKGAFHSLSLQLRNSFTYQKDEPKDMLVSVQIIECPQRSLVNQWICTAEFFDKRYFGLVKKIMFCHWPEDTPHLSFQTWDKKLNLFLAYWWHLFAFFNFFNMICKVLRRIALNDNIFFEKPKWRCRCIWALFFDWHAVIWACINQ